jgi:hypothetical protein
MSVPATTAGVPSRKARARRPRALFVLGVPRSGTTVIGNYLGSAPGVLNFAEYGGFYAAHSMTPAVMERLPGHHHAEYLAEVRRHARGFAERMARANGAVWYLDHTPWNLEVAAALAEDPADALFVLILRHYSGNVLSLRRFPWAGDSWEDVARLWTRLNGNVIDLPADRVVTVGYDALATDPAGTLAALITALGKHGYPVLGLDARLLGMSHAAIIGEPRPVIGVTEDDEVGGLRPIRSFDAERWSGDIHARVWPIVKDMHAELLRRFSGSYCCPPPPGPLRIHDDSRGLIRYELQGWLHLFPISV